MTKWNPSSWDAAMQAICELLEAYVPDGYARCEYCHELISASTGAHHPHCPLLLE